MSQLGYCRQCGSQTAIGDIFCTRCGASLRKAGAGKGQGKDDEIGGFGVPEQLTAIGAGVVFASVRALKRVVGENPRKEKESMQRIETVEEDFYDMSEVEEDIAFGQIVIITARWIMIAGALVLTLWQPMAPSAEDFWRLPLQVALLLGYAVVNFFLQAQYSRQGPGLPAVVYATSLVDLGLITLIIAIQPNAFASGVYVFYFPALMALAVAFPPRTAAAYTIGVMVVYAMLAFGDLPPGGADADAIQAVSLRLIMMGAVAFCGALYQRIEHDRRSGKATPVGVLSKAAPQRRRPQPRRRVN